MLILMMAVNDPAGMAIAFANAINRYTPHTCRLVTLETRYNFMFAKDLHLPWLDDDGLAEVECLLKTADVYHFHMTADEYLRIGPFLPADHIKGKKIVHHHHGHPDYRSNPEPFRQKYAARGRKNILVSTPDLLRLFPEAAWQPNIVPVHDHLYLPFEGKPDAPFLLCHSPTRKDLKNTDELLTTVAELQAANTPLNLRLIEMTAHTDCLRQKRRCHALFDHMQGYFGVSSLEALAQGLAVIAGLDDWNSRHILDFTGAASLPWLVAHDTTTLKSLLHSLATNPDLTTATSHASRTFMTSHWTEQQIITPLVHMYER